MYRHCTFCAEPLGTNEVVEQFPIGRRLAFDSSRGRLWVICRRCQRWNLTPLEARWEAVEECERLYRQIPLRASTDQIGLARHREGLELIRIGEPLRPEFAAWRYGDQFGARRRRFIRNGALTLGAVAAGSVLAGTTGIVGGLAAINVGLHAVNAANLARAALVPELRLPRDDGEPLVLLQKHLPQTRLRPAAPGGSGPGSWALEVHHREGGELLSGNDAVRALRILLPRHNRSGARRSTLQAALSELEEAGGPEAYFQAAEYRARRIGRGYLTLPALPAPIRLALEMAAHEDSERVAVEGEFAWLEEAWREAEEIAAIADLLTLSERVEARYQALKARYGKKRAEPEG